MNTEIEKELFYLGNYISFLEQDIQDTIEIIPDNPKYKTAMETAHLQFNFKSQYF